jgi:RluA family pseudouridine synthase
MARSRKPSGTPENHLPRDLSKPLTCVKLRVRKEFEGTRLDRFLSTKLEWRSRVSIQDLIAEGRIRVSGRQVKKATKLAAGDVVEIDVPPPDVPLEYDRIDLDILYEDEGLVAINKGPHILCHPTGPFLHNTIINVLHHRYRRLDRPEEDIIPRLCHRLDQMTSGVLLVAKSKKVRRAMQEEFEARRVKKEYLAVTEGEWKAGSRGTIELPLRRDTGGEVKSRMVVTPEGLPSWTQYRVEERFRGYTLLRLSPITGRQHQIRAHLAYSGYPVLCDILYGKDAWPRPKQGNRAFPRTGKAVIQRHALHAERIRFRHPVRGKAIEIVAPLPGDFRDLLRHLRCRYPSS